jgi:integrase/recombinase XerD
MSLTLYRRHSVDCRVHNLGLTPRAVRHYRDCECPIWIAGTTDTQRYPRQSVGTRDWGAAEATLRSFQATAIDTAVHGPTIADCVRRYLDAHAANVTDVVLGQYKHLLGRLEAFARSRNKLFMSDLTVDLCEDFKVHALRDLRSTTRHIAVAKLKVFLRESYRRGWTTDALAEKVRSTRAVYEQKKPYTDDEVSLILDETSRLGGVGRGRGYTSNPHTFRLLVELMLATGLRVSDAVRYDPTRCTRGEHLWVYSFEPQKQHKNHHARTAEVFLTDPLKRAIDSAGWFSLQYPFAYRAFDGSANTLENNVYRCMQGIGERCGVPDCRPHRLRDTFAVRMLLRGVPVDEVSRLLCHSSVTITEKYYAPWVTSRLRRLEGLVAEALVNPVGN